MDRLTRLRAGATQATRILEVGPSHAPAAARADGWRTETVDHTDTESLRAKYAAMGVDTSRIEGVDHVWQGGSLAECIPADRHASYDLLIASHVVEHLPDLVGLMLSAQSLLSPAGAISFAVPDKRYCFDFFKPITTTGDLLAAHAAAKLPTGGIHSRRSAWNHLAYSVTVDNAIAWGQHPVSTPRFIHNFQDAEQAMAAWRDDGSQPYADYHAWQFTPSSFALIILELGMIGAIDWHIAEQTEAEGCEFFALLRRGAERPDPAALQLRRMDLLRGTMREMAEQLTWFGIVKPTTPAPADTGELTAQLQRHEARLALLEARPPWTQSLAAIVRRIAGMRR
jgi:hypothetical protein